MSRNQRRNRRNKPGGNQTANRNATRHHGEDPTAEAVHHRSSTETKSSLKTTELIAYVGAVLAVIMTALAVDEHGRGGDDPFGAESAIRYITYLTVGYLLARGLAKSGSHEHRIEHDTDDDVARAGAAHDEEVRGDADERAGDERVSDERVSDAAGAAVGPSDRGQPTPGAAR